MVIDRRTFLRAVMAVPLLPGLLQVDPDEPEVAESELSATDDRSAPEGTDGTLPGDTAAQATDTPRAEATPTPRPAVERAMSAERRASKLLFSGLDGFVQNRHQDGGAAGWVRTARGMYLFESADTRVTSTQASASPENFGGKIDSVMTFTDFEAYDENMFILAEVLIDGADQGVGAGYSS